MKEMDILRSTLCDELKHYSTLKNISHAELDIIHELTDTIKNIDKIKMLNDTVKDDYDNLDQEDRMVIKRALEMLDRNKF